MKKRRTAEFVGSVVANLIVIVIVNTAMLWRHLTGGVILESWTDILWAANLSLVVQVIGNVLLAVYRPARLYSLVQALLSAAGLVSVVVFYRVFPLDFSQLMGSWLNTLAKAVLIIAIVGSSIAMVVHLARALIGTQYHPVPTEGDEENQE